MKLYVVLTNPKIQMPWIFISESMKFFSNDDSKVLYEGV